MFSSCCVLFVPPHSLEGRLAGFQLVQMLVLSIYNLAFIMTSAKLLLSGISMFYCSLSLGFITHNKSKWKQLKVKPAHLSMKRPRQTYCIFVINLYCCVYPFCTHSVDCTSVRPQRGIPPLLHFLSRNPFFPSHFGLYTTDKTILTRLWVDHKHPVFLHQTNHGFFLGSKLLCLFSAVKENRNFRL